MRSLQYSVYKGMTSKWGALQINFQPSHYYHGKQKDFNGNEAFNNDGKLKDGWKVREGCIFLEITSTKDANVYDWDNKIIMALSINDIGKLLFTLTTGQECKIMHDPGAKTEHSGQVKKFLTINSPKGTAAGVMVSATSVSGEDNKVTHTVPLTGDEVIVLRQLCLEAIPRCLAW